jgi:hypothetical protein
VLRTPPPDEDDQPRGPVCRSSSAETGLHLHLRRTRRSPIKVSSTNGRYFYKVKREEIAPVETSEALVCLGVKSDKLDAR